MMLSLQLSMAHNENKNILISVSVSQSSLKDKLVITILGESGHSVYERKRILVSFFVSLSLALCLFPLFLLSKLILIHIYRRNVTEKQKYVIIIFD